MYLEREQDGQTEELEMLSYFEANLPEGTPNVNQALQAYFSERTLLAIKRETPVESIIEAHKDQPDNELDRERIQDTAILTTGDFHALRNILRAFSDNDYEEDLNSYITENFTRQPTVRNVTRRIIELTDRRPKIRLKKYIRYQRIFRDNKKQLANDITNDADQVQVHPREISIREVYQRIYESESLAEMMLNTSLLHLSRVGRYTSHR